MTTKDNFVPTSFKKWFWGFFLGQAIITGGILLIQWGSTQKTLETHSNDIDAIKSEMKTKATINMVIEVKTDLKENQKTIIDDVKYIRQRIDEHMSNSDRLPTKVLTQK